VTSSSPDSRFCICSCRIRLNAILHLLASHPPQRRPATWILASRLRVRTSRSPRHASAAGHQLRRCLNNFIRSFEGATSFHSTSASAKTYTSAVATPVKKPYSLATIAGERRITAIKATKDAQAGNILSCCN